MARENELAPIFQCGECSLLFIQFTTHPVAGKIYQLCPNCYGPRVKCAPVDDNSVRWLFNHILLHSGMNETRRMALRDIAESAMGPWHPSYRQL